MYYTGLRPCSHERKQLALAHNCKHGEGRRNIRIYLAYLDFIVFMICYFTAVQTTYILAEITPSLWNLSSNGRLPER